MWDGTIHSVTIWWTYSLENLPSSCPYAPTRALCSSTSRILQLPRTNLRFGSRSFRLSTPILWNSLPHSVRLFVSMNLLTTFLKHLKTFIFNRHYLTTQPQSYPSVSDSVLCFGTIKIHLLTHLLTNKYRRWPHNRIYRAYYQGDGGKGEGSRRGERKEK